MGRAAFEAPFDFAQGKQAEQARPTQEKSRFIAQTARDGAEFRAARFRFALQSEEHRLKPMPLGEEQDPP